MLSLAEEITDFLICREAKVVYESDTHVLILIGNAED